MAKKIVNPNILSLRYASNDINRIFSERQKTIDERGLWIAVMKSQKQLGLDIPSEDIERYERAKEDIDLDRIAEIEKVTRHDVKAKIQAFNEAAGVKKGHAHKGLTSRGLTDNVEQMQIKNAAELILGKYSSVLRHFADKAREYQDIVLTARTHHQAAQPTMLGRRFAMWADEIWDHFIKFEDFIAHYPLRGIKGPVGTQSDMLKLLKSEEKVIELEQSIADQLGFSRVCEAPGQVYPRSLDYELTSHLAIMSSGVENFAKGMRLMSGYELVTEGFKDGQVGSSAMPHKMNTRSSERVCGFSELLKMYADGGSRLSGDQWEEGDVSCSVIRRVIVPDAFYASDGLCETALTVLNEMGAYEAVISKEVDRYLPFLATTEILMEAVEAGIGREEAHEIIKQYAVGEALKMRQQGTETNNLPALLGSNDVFAGAGITQEKIEGILGERSHFVGRARQQIDSVCEHIDNLIRRKEYARASQYEPGDIL